MPAPVGHWRIISSGFQGNLDITADAVGNVSGSVQFDATNVLPIRGFWDEAEQRIIFQFNVGGSPQNFTGYLFSADAPLFQDGRFGGPGNNPAFLMLAGSFDAFGSGGTGQRPFFGWVARQSRA